MPVELRAEAGDVVYSLIVPSAFDVYMCASISVCPKYRADPQKRAKSSKRSA